MKNVPLVKQNVMKLEVSILGRQELIRRERRDGGEGGERIEKGSREGIEIGRKETKGTELRISRETSTLASACCSASSRHGVPDCKALQQ